MFRKCTIFVKIIVMKIAVTYEKGSVFQHFGHTATFKLYSIENNAVVNSEIVGTNGQGPTPYKRCCKSNCCFS